MNEKEMPKRINVLKTNTIIRTVPVVICQEIILATK